jgi:hypothetical protein
MPRNNAAASSDQKAEGVLRAEPAAQILVRNCRPKRIARAACSNSHQCSEASWFKVMHREH